MPITKLVLLPLFFASVVSYGVTPLVIRIANKYKLVDDPNKNKHPKKIHKSTIPRAGGLSVFAGLVATTTFFLPIDKYISAILAGAVLVVFVGLLDDRYDLSPWLRLFLNFLAAAIPIAAGIGIAYVSNPLGGIIDVSYPRYEFYLLGEHHSLWVLPDLFALFWIVILMNFLNMGAKGIQGQLPGTAAIASLVIAMLSFSFSADIAEWPVTILASITAGAFLGFLPWNYFPQKIMSGYSGSTLAGFMLGVLSILTTTKVGTLLIVLAIPIIDTVFVVLNRVRSGKSPMHGDTTHLHHKLLRAGLTKKQVVYFYWTVSGFLGILSLTLNTFSKITTLVILSVVFAGLIIAIDLYLRSKDANSSN
ncbi:glycosyltransferase family 4 protein [Patescibacteria group bacterium]